MNQDKKICPYRFKQMIRGDGYQPDPKDSICAGEECGLWTIASWDGQPVEGCAKWVEVQLQYLRWVYEYGS